MSLQTVTDFIKRVGEDEEIYTSIKKLQGKDFTGLLRIAEQAGYPFSAEEWKAVAARIAGDLSDEDLDQVTGGALSFNSSSLQLKVSPVLQGFISPINLLGSSCGEASCSCR